MTSLLSMLDRFEQAAANFALFRTEKDERALHAARRAILEHHEFLQTSRSNLIDYSTDLQRIIEDLCNCREIRPPETTARFHYDMAVASLSALVEREAELVKALEAKQAAFHRRGEKIIDMAERETELLAALTWVRANYAAGSTKEINERIDAALHPKPKSAE